MNGKGQAAAQRAYGSLKKAPKLKAALTIVRRREQAKKAAAPASKLRQGGAADAKAPGKPVKK